MVGVQWLHKTLHNALDLLFPPRCAACQRGGHLICPSCLAAITPLTPPLCQLCGRPNTTQQHCTSCFYAPLRITGVRCVSAYEAPLRPCIHALKYKSSTRLALPLGTLLAQAYQRYALHVDTIVPVPLHTEREQQRGYNQSLLLARVCAQQLNLPLQPELLQRVRATPAQVGLSGSERHQNVAGAFTCLAPSTTVGLVGRRILLVDDVATTGATLAACATPLFDAGASAVWGLVLARPFGNPAQDTHIVT